MRRIIDFELKNKEYLTTNYTSLFSVNPFFKAF